MSSWEVTIARVDCDGVPPTLYDIKGDPYQGNSEDCEKAARILDSGRKPQATVTDKNDSGKILRPPHVLGVS